MYDKINESVFQTCEIDRNPERVVDHTLKGGERERGKKSVNIESAVRGSFFPPLSLSLLPLAPTLQLCSPREMCFPQT